MTCQGLFGRLFGHNYGPRYSTIPPHKIELGTGSGAAMATMIAAMSQRIYEGDVCSRCGASVMKDESK